MSESEHEHNHGFMWQWPTKDDLEMANLAMVSGLHDQHDVIESLTQDQFDSVLQIIKFCLNNPEGGHYLMGRYIYQYNLRFDKCLKCGQDAHDPSELLQPKSDNDG